MEKKINGALGTISFFGTNKFVLAVDHGKLNLSFYKVLDNEFSPIIRIKSAMKQNEQTEWDSGFFTVFVDTSK